MIARSHAGGGSGAKRQHREGWLMKQHLAALLAMTAALPAMAGGQLAGSGGVSQIEGAGGGGLVPWALIAGTATRDQWSPTAFHSRLSLPQYEVTSQGVALGLYNRYEFSYAQQEIDINEVVPDAYLRQDIIGFKLRVAGNAIVDQDMLLPQLEVGVFYKQGRKFLHIPGDALGARRSRDVELYAAATKIWLDGIVGRTTLLNATLRYTRANQFGLLGFGGDTNANRELCLELSSAVFVNDQWLLGAEYRQKPDNLSAAEEEAAYDLFVAWLPYKQLALTVAWVSLGSIVNQPSQDGAYASLQLSY